MLPYYDNNDDDNDDNDDNDNDNNDNNNNTIIISAALNDCNILSGEFQTELVPRPLPALRLAL